jgi:hypothetical protein
MGARGHVRGNRDIGSLACAVDINRRALARASADVSSSSLDRAGRGRCWSSPAAAYSVCLRGDRDEERKFQNALRKLRTTARARWPA